MARNEIKDFGFVFWLHLVVILLIYSSPFLFSWHLILLGVIAYYLQIVFLGTCLLARAQFHSRQGSFYRYYLTKMGFQFNEKRLAVVVDHVIPWTVFAVSLIWQIALGHKAPVSF